MTNATCPARRTDTNNNLRAALRAIVAYPSDCDVAWGVDLARWIADGAHDDGDSNADAWEMRAALRRIAGDVPEAGDAPEVTLWWIQEVAADALVAVGD